MNNPNLSPYVYKLALWLQQRCEERSYGTFEIGVVLHGGTIRQVTYSAKEMTKPARVSPSNRTVNTEGQNV